MTILDIAKDLLADIVKIGAAYYAATAVDRYFKNRKQKTDIHYNNMESEFLRKQEIMPILENIRYQLEADRVIECIFSNGDTTFTGVHLKKISIALECNRDGIEDLSPYFQLIPAKKFDRTLTALFESKEDYTVSYEHEFSDDLATLNQSFGLNTMLLVKIRDSVNKWVGYIVVGYEDPYKEIDQESIVFTKLQAARIGAINK